MQKTTKSMVAGIALWLACAATQAAVDAQAAALLGTTLTPWGAEIAGTPDGSYPRYEGGLAVPPSGFDPKSGVWPDPFPDDKPLFSIDAGNMEQYRDQLMEAQMELMRRYPGYRLDVYPTRRSAMIPEQAARNALANARNPECKTSSDGVGLYGCWGGTPFPSPKTGYEAMWNHLLTYTSAGETNSVGYLANANGAITMLLLSHSVSDYPYFTRSRNPTRDLASISCAPSRRRWTPRARPEPRRCCGIRCITIRKNSGRGATRRDNAGCASHRNSPTTPRWHSSAARCSSTRSTCSPGAWTASGSS